MKKLHRWYALFLCAALVVGSVMPAAAETPGETAVFVETEETDESEDDGGESAGETQTKEEITVDTGEKTIPDTFETEPESSEETTGETEDMLLESENENLGEDSILEQQVKVADEASVFRTFSAVEAGVIGTPGRPFSIASEEALLDMQAKMNSNATYEVDGQVYTYSSASYRLDAEVVLSGAVEISIANMDNGFNFDGQNNKISGFIGDKGLFDSIASGCTVKNLVLEGNIVNAESMGMLCAYNYGNIENCTVLGSINGTDVGGIAYENNGTIASCVSSAFVEGTGCLAGITVYYWGGELVDCQNTGNVHGLYVEADNYRSPVGGITAEAYAEIKNCSNSGNISNEDGDYGHAGGISGYTSENVIIGCVNEGMVDSGTAKAGGIVGYGYYATITGSHNSGTISGLGNGLGIFSESGGIQGMAEGGSISGCYNTGYIRRNGEAGMAGGIVGSIQYDASVENCWNSGTTMARDTGGIAGQIGYMSGDSSSVKNCYNIGAVNGSSYAGGIAGHMASGGIIENCYNTGKISITGTSTYVGGISADATGVTIKNCYALNESIYNENGTGGGRIYQWGSRTTASGNFGWAQMLIDGQPVTGGQADNRDGADVTSDELLDSNNTSGLWSTFSEDIWSKTDGGLPILAGVGEELQTREFPQHIIDGAAEEPEGVNLEVEGTPSAPYKITTENEWRYIVSKMNSVKEREHWLAASYVLENDLDLSEISIQSAASGGTYYAFKGHLDGQYHTISGLTWSGNSSSNPKISGLFAYVDASGVVENLTVDGSLMRDSGTGGVALLAGNNAGTNTGTVISCRSTGSITSSRGYAGGIVASQSGASASVQNCYSAAVVSGNYAGGIIGYMSGGSVNENVSLGETVSGATGEGRIFGYSQTSASASGNVAWADMTNVQGEPVRGGMTGAHNNYNGKDVRSGLFGTTVFWETAGFDTVIWKLEEGMIPALTWEQNQEALPLWLLEPGNPALEGEGTEESPYIIKSVDDLVYAMEQIDQDEAYRSASYQLTSDIDMSGISWQAIGTEAEPFTGVFDGGNHRISHLDLKENAMYQGFFGVTDGAVIRNLIVQGSVTGGDYSGGLVGYAKDGTLIEACQSKIDVYAYTQEGATAGGIAGINEGTIRHCIQKGNIKGQSAAGGIAAINNGSIRLCAAMEEKLIISGGAGVVGKIAVSNSGTLEDNFAWSDMEILENFWVLAEGYYPMLMNQTDMNYILPHQVHDGQEMIQGLSVELAVPTAEAVPETVLTGDGWQAHVSWTPEAVNAFDYDTAYTAQVTLTAENGYIFAEDLAVTFNGEAAEVQVNNNKEAVFTYVFDKTAKDIQTVALEFDAPQAEGAPTKEMTGDGWTAWIQWDPEVTDVFDYGTAYTAVIVIRPDTGYILTENTVFSLNGMVVEAEQDAAGQVVISYLFDKTEDKTPETSETEETTETEETIETDETEETTETTETDETEETSETETKQQETSSHSPETESEKTENGGSDGPKTGDSVPVTALIILLLISASGICVILSRRGKEKRRDI